MKFDRAFSFNPELASKYGLEEAVMIEHFRSWIYHNRTHGKNLRDGRTWSFSTLEGLAEYFPFWTVKVVRRLLQSLIAKGVLKIGNYNKSTYDRTQWYGFRDEQEFLPLAFAQTGKCIRPNGQIDLPDQADRFAQTGTPIQVKEKTSKGNTKEKNPPSPPSGGATEKPHEPENERGDPAYEHFAARFAHHRPTAYRPKKGDFVKLAGLRADLKIGGRESPPGWETAVENYLRSDLRGYTLADLCSQSRYDVFLLSAVDRFGHPAQRVLPISQEPLETIQRDFPEPTLDLVLAWNQVLAKVEGRVRPEVFKIWFQNTKLFEVAGGEARVEVPNGFFEDWLNEHADVVLPILKEILSATTSVVFLSRVIQKKKGAA